MGLFTAGGCVSRILGPVAVGSIYTRYGTSWTFGITCIMMILPMIWLYILRDRLDIVTKSVKDVELTEVKSLKVTSTNGLVQDRSMTVNENDLNSESESFLSKEK